MQLFFPPKVLTCVRAQDSHCRHLTRCKTDTDKLCTANVKLTFSIQDFFCIHIFLYVCTWNLAKNSHCCNLLRRQIMNYKVYAKDANWIKLLGIFNNTKSAVSFESQIVKNFLFLSWWRPYIFERSLETSKSLQHVGGKRQHTCKTPAYLVHTQDRRKWFIICPLNFSEHSV